MLNPGHAEQAAACPFRHVVSCVNHRHGMNRLYYLVAVLILASAAFSKCLASDHVVTVHLIDAKTGNTIPRGNLELWWLSAPKSWEKLREKVQPDGTAEFHLPDPPPSEVQVRLGKSMGYWYECSTGVYNTNDILQRGVSEQADIWPKTKFPNISYRFHPKPGEVYYFACHIPFGEYLKTWFRSLK